MAGTRGRMVGSVEDTAAYGDETDKSFNIITKTLANGKFSALVADAMTEGFDESIENFRKNFVASTQKIAKMAAQLQLKNAETVEQYKKNKGQQIEQKLTTLRYKLQEAELTKASEKQIKAIKDQIGLQEKAKEDLKKLDDKQSDEYKKAEKDLARNREKNAKKLAKLIRAENQKNEQEALDNIKKQGEEYGKIGENFYIYTRSAKQALVDELEAQGNSEQDAKRKAAGLQIGNAINQIANWADSLKTAIDQIADGKKVIDTALQGSSMSTRMGSYYDQLVARATWNIGVSPLVKQEDYMKNVNEAVTSGIAFNVEQRAFLATIKDNIASTFNVFDGNLAKLIRVQQEDTTAGRLGMESALTSFMNSMYETSEYMKNTFDTVTSNLTEASSLMTGKAATEFEYQVQKWLGSLYSVGISDNAVGNISNALGQVAAGKVEGITGGGAGNLVVMAANQAGLSIADVLKDGLNSDETNKLLNAMVNYLAGIYNSSKDSHVVQQQMANVFGLSASDLKAVANLAKADTVKNITNTNYGYSNMLSRLTEMTNTMYLRTSVGGMIGNLTNNFKYSMASGIANDPITYITYEMANMLQDLTGGIKLPDIKVMGTGINLNTTVANLMKVASMSGGILNGVVGLVGGLKNIVPSNMLNSFGINSGTTAVQRGTPSIASGVSGESTSESGYVGTSSGQDIYNKTLTDATDQAKQQLVEAQESQEADIPNRTVNESILSIYRLLTDVVDGSRSLHVVNDFDLSFSQPGNTGGSTVI